MGSHFPKVRDNLDAGTYAYIVREKDVFFTYYILFSAKQEMSWQISRSLDKEGGKEKLGTRFPFLELQMFTYHFPGDEDGARKYFPGY